MCLLLYNPFVVFQNRWDAKKNYLFSDTHNEANTPEKADEKPVPVKVSMRKGLFKDDKPDLEQLDRQIPRNRNMSSIYGFKL